MSVALLNVFLPSCALVSLIGAMHWPIICVTNTYFVCFDFGVQLCSVVAVFHYMLCIYVCVVWI